MKNILLFLTLIISNVVLSQFCPFLGPDQTLPCGVTQTTLTADLSQCGPGSNPNQTTNYGVTNIPYVAQVNNGANVGLGDDAVSQLLNIGFTFCFFGNTYTQFYIGSNGWIGFSGGQPATFASVPIPTAAANVPKNCIMGPWQDWHPGIGGQIRYQTTGVAPCRKLTVSWVNVPMYSCTNLQGTFHIVIYESTNVIENHIQNKPGCPQWAFGTAVQGIHNLAGNLAIPVPGRNSTQWTTQNNSYRWTPSGPVVTPTLTWFQVGNPNPIGTGQTITVTPPVAGANYTCRFVYPTCNAGWSTCNAVAGLGPDTVFVQPGPPNLTQPNVVIQNPNCFNSCDGQITVNPVGGSSPILISWTQGLGNSFTINNLCAGSYNYNLIDNLGCGFNGVVTLVDPPQITINPILGSDTVCFNSNNNPYTTQSPFNNLTYNWTSTIGTLTGNGTPNVLLDVTGVLGGTYPNALTVIAQDALGCLSPPQSFTIVDLNIIPQIAQVGPICDYDNCVQLSATPVGGQFSGIGVQNSQFCPTTQLAGPNTITYTYLQSGCQFTETSQIQVNPRPQFSIEIDGQITNSEYHELCEGDSISDVYQSLFSQPGYTEWYTFGDTLVGDQINLTWDAEGIFQFQAVRWELGCSSYPQNITVTIQLCPQELIYIPNSFTPDGDEHNQLFSPIITSGVDIYEFHMTIYNRWGETIWESFDTTGKWDGTYNGKICPDGLYNWTIEFGLPKNDGRKELNGSIRLIR
jgi:gliding motility-associated-like protein